MPSQRPCRKGLSECSPSCCKHGSRAGKSRSGRGARRGEPGYQEKEGKKGCGSGRVFRSVLQVRCHVRVIIATAHPLQMRLFRASSIALSETGIRRSTICPLLHLPRKGPPRLEMPLQLARNLPERRIMQSLRQRSASSPRLSGRQARSRPGRFDVDGSRGGTVEDE